MDNINYMDGGSLSAAGEYLKDKISEKSTVQIMTQEEYDELPDTKTIDGVIRMIDNTKRFWLVRNGKVLDADIKFDANNSYSWQSDDFLITNNYTSAFLHPFLNRTLDLSAYNKMIVKVCGWKTNASGAAYEQGGSYTPWVIADVLNQPLTSAAWGVKRRLKEEYILAENAKEIIAADSVAQFYDTIELDISDIISGVPAIQIFNLDCRVIDWYFV